jgi:hypothetical protein
VRSMKTVTAVVAVLALTLGASMLPSGATPPTDDPTTAAGYGARWLAGLVTSEGYVEGPGGAPASGPTVQAAISLAAAGVEGAAFDRAMAWLAANVETVIAPGGTDSPGVIGYLLIAVRAAGGGATDFGGVNLVSRLAATLDVHEAGLYGAADPSFDGVFRQSLAVLGLRAHGAPVPPGAVGWLLDQQCGAGSPADAVGGWEPYRVVPALPCGSPDPAMFSGPETNSTAFAVQALAAVGSNAASDPLVFLAGAQDSSGGWAFIPGLDVDPNSTALVIQGLIAAGEDPSAWAMPGGDPYTSLLSWQIGCDADPADIGAFASPFSGGFPDQFATLQAVWGAAGTAFPLGEAGFSPAPVPCEANPSPTAGPHLTVPTPPAGGAGVGGTDRTTPRFAG